jgi:hypothetical protein
MFVGTRNDSEALNSFALFAYFAVKNLRGEAEVQADILAAGVVEIWGMTLSAGIGLPK